jgi:hypothetical protein
MAKRRRKRIESPTSDCLLLCDDVLNSHRTQKHNLIGVIGGISVAEFPALIGGYVAYVRLTNVYGHQSVDLMFRAADDGEPLFTATVETPEKANPLDILTLVIRTPMFTVAKSGRYIFSAEYNGVEFVSTAITISSRSEGDRNG